MPGCPPPPRPLPSPLPSAAAGLGAYLRGSSLRCRWPRRVVRSPAAPPPLLIPPQPHPTPAACRAADYLVNHMSDATSLDVSGLDWGRDDFARLAATMQAAAARGALQSIQFVILDGQPADEAPVRAVLEEIRKAQGLDA